MSQLEQELLFQIRALGLPEPTRELQIIAQRRFRWGFAWPERRLAVEVQGDIWRRTNAGRSAGHANPSRIAKDYEKHNLVTLLGWRVLYFTPGMIRSGKAVDVLQVAIERFRGRAT